MNLVLCISYSVWRISFLGPNMNTNIFVFQILTEYIRESIFQRKWIKNIYSVYEYSNIQIFIDRIYIRYSYSFKFWLTNIFDIHIRSIFETRIYSYSYSVPKMIFVTHCLIGNSGTLCLKIMHYFHIKRGLFYRSRTGI